MASQDAFEAAQRFLAPLSGKRGRFVRLNISDEEEKSAKGQTSLLNILGPEEQEEDEKRASVVSKTLELLRQIHEAIIVDAKSASAEKELLNPRHSRIINTCLDLVVLEGIYPFLSPGVGVPIDQRLKTAIPADRSVQVSTQIVTPQDNHLLSEVIRCLTRLARDRPNGLGNSIWDRCFIDLVSGTGELTFNPFKKAENADNWIWLWQKAETSSILKLVSALKLPDVPIWLRSEITSKLSTLPLRPHGVEQILSHFSFSQEALPNETDGPRDSQQQPPSITLNGLLQAARLLRAIPTSMTPEDYLLKISPQLLDLLDGRRGLDLQAAAGFVIANILAQRTLGTPGAPGWVIFALPVLDSIKSKVSPVSESKGISLQNAVHRLKSMFVVNVNEGVARRLIGPMLLEIWSLVLLKNSLSEDSTFLIRTYLMTSDVLSAVERILYSLSGSKPGSSLTYDALDALSLESLSNLDKHVATLSDILDYSGISDEIITSVFFGLCNSILDNSDSKERDLILKLVKTKLAEELLQRCGSRVLEHPGKLVKLCSAVLSAAIENDSKDRQAPSLNELGSITNAKQSTSESWENSETAVSLLANVLSIDDLAYSQDDLHQLEALQTILIPFLSKQSKFSSSLQVSLRNLATLIEVTLAEQLLKTADANPHRQDAEAYQTAMKTIVSSKDPSSRGQAVQSVASLISSRSPVLDIQSTLVMLISLLQEDEEFVYVNVIKALSELARLHSKTTALLLMEAYSDEKEERSVDFRLRIGEALLRTIQELGTALVDETANLIGTGMLSIGSRRAHKQEKARKTREAIDEKQKRHKEAEDAWGGDIPDIREQEDEETASKEAIIEHIVDGWSGREAKDEDIRIRTSALSILGTAIETNLAGVGSRICSEALDMSLAIMTLEIRPADAILRRAAARLVLSVLDALQSAAAAGKRLAFELNETSLEDAIRVLSFVADTDSDHIVKGHASSVVERLKSHRSDMILLSQHITQSTELHSIAGLPALSTSHSQSESERRPRIEEIE